MNIHQHQEMNNNKKYMRKVLLMVKCRKSDEVRKKNHQFLETTIVKLVQERKLMNPKVVSS